MVMQIDIDLFSKIYRQLGDETSKEIFKNRLMYSMSEDSRWIFETIKFVRRGNCFLKQLEHCSIHGEIVIFGAGVWGKDLQKITRTYPWKCFVDNHPKASEMHGLPVIRGNEFLERYHDEYIFISSRIFYKEIYEQLIRAGIPVSNIINVGEVLDELSAVQYFDLEYLKPAGEKEIFLDVGGFDGMTSVYFSKWSQRDSFVYVFEPDVDNVVKCRKNLENHYIKYKIIPKGAWSERTILKFQSVANGSSNITTTGEEAVPVTTIDNELATEKVTFIKMDIEGSELQALIGSEYTIINNKPKLAISIYHKPEDIWEIPDIILKYNPSYKLFLRHYSLTDYETVLYALPDV